MGNPPYSVGQKSANDNAQNQSYEKLEGRIADTYVKESEAGLNKSAYDSYIKAFRWASDRITTIQNGGYNSICVERELSGRQCSGRLQENSGEGIRQDLCIQSEGKSADERRTFPTGGREDFRERKPDSYSNYSLSQKGDGIVAFVSNGSWLDGNAQDGFRKTLEKEFSKIYVFNLRGNCRTSGELRKKEAGNVFGLGSRTPIAVTVLVKKNGE